MVTRPAGPRPVRCVLLSTLVGGRIAVVTDSTAYLPAGYAERFGVRVVPLYVVIDGVVGAEGAVTPDEVAQALDRRLPVTTSRPTPAHFRAAYTDLLDAGADGIVSVHLSRELSGTWDSARRAAEEVAGGIGGPIRVVDSRSTGMGLGFSVLAAARASDQGADLAGVTEAVWRTAARTITVFYVDTLEHLRRGGRIGAAQALLGTALSVKPILRVRDGRIVPVDKVRTASRALVRLEDLVVRLAGDDPVDVAVQHLAAPERAEALAARLRARIPRLGALLRSPVGAVVGAHVGPRVLGVVVSRTDAPG